MLDIVEFIIVFVIFPTITLKYVCQLGKCHFYQEAGGLLKIGGSCTFS